MEESQTDVAVPWVFALTLSTHKELVSLRQHLANNGIETRPFFKPIHSQLFMKTHLNEKTASFPNSEEQYLTGLYLPTYQ